MIETHRSIVQPAECDGNQHLNVAFYVKRFSEAGQNLFAMHKKGKLAYRPKNRHFLFHQELTPNALTAILSIRIGKGKHKGQILHVMQDLTKARIAATCLDSQFDHPVKFIPKTNGGAPVNAQPRLLKPEPYPEPSSNPNKKGEHSKTNFLLKNHLAMIGNRNKVKANECDIANNMHDSDIVGHFFTSASQLWPYSGFDFKWFDDNNYGGVAVEMKLTLHELPRKGDDFAIISWVPEINGKLLPLSNQMVSVPDNKPYASISAISLVIDQHSRLPVDIPDSVIRKHAARFKGLEQHIPF